jgi:hypothetical protein
VRDRRNDREGGIILHRHRPARGRGVACLDRLDGLPADARGDDPCREDGRDLGADPQPAGGDAAADRPTPEERAGEGRWEWHGSEVLERCALGSLTALEDGAVVALAEVSAERASLGTRQLALGEARKGELRLLARESSFELLAKGAASTEDQGLDGADGEVEDFRDLGVRAALELPHYERGALVEREEAERTADLAGRRDVRVLGRRCGEALVELHLLRAARRVAEALPADVVGNLDQPVVRAMRALAALERAVGVEEGGLGDVLCVGLVVEDRERVAVDGMDVPPVELLEGALGGALGLRDRGSHYWRDAFRRSFLRSGDGHGSTTGEIGRALRSLV